jgi:hypothetical protein
MSGGATLTRKFIASADPARSPSVQTVRLICPHCDCGLGRNVRVVLERTWSAGKRPAATEAYLACSQCRRAWVATLRPAIATFEDVEVAR